MIELETVVLISDAARMLGRTPEAFRKAFQRGQLEGKQIGPRCIITTHEAAAQYVARVASTRRVGHLRDEQGLPRKRPRR